eukprot:gene22797-29517_t
MLPVHSEDILHAYLSEVSYATLKNDMYSQNTSWKRVNAALKSPDIVSKIGNNWEVLSLNGSHLSNQDAAVVINSVDHKIALLCRGTSTFVNDVLINDIGGGFHLTHDRAQKIFELGNLAKIYVKNNPEYTLSATGHSLGGSLAAEVGRLLDCDTYTFNAPDLRHGLRELSDSLINVFNKSKLHAFRLDFDPISKIGVKDTVAITLESRDHPIGLKAHFLEYMIGALEDSFKSMHGFLPDVSNKELIIRGTENRTGFDRGVVWSSNRTDIAYSFHDNKILQVQYTSHHADGNLFFTRDVNNTVVIDIGQGKLQSMTAINEALSSVLSKNSHVNLAHLSRYTAISMGKNFASSALSAQVNHALEGLVATGGLRGIEAAYSFLHGDKQGAIKASIDSLASSILQAGLGLPFSYSTNYQVSTGDLFGSRSLYSYEKSYELGLSSSTVLDRFIGQVSLGLAFNRISDVYTLRNHQLVQREASGVDGYIRMGPTSASLGVYSGVETYQPLTTTHADGNGNDVTRSVWGSKSFEGQLILRVHTGNWEEHRADGNPFENRHSDHNSFLHAQPNALGENVTLDSLEANLPTLKEYQDAIDWHYTPGQLRSYNDDGTSTVTDFAATRPEHGGDIRSGTTDFKNANNENVQQVRRVQELGNETSHSSDATTLTDNGQLSTDTRELDTVIEAFGDVRSETTDGVTVSYNEGQKQEYRFEIGKEHTKLKVVMKADHTAFSKDHSLGKREFNAVGTDNATMDVYAKEKGTSDVVQQAFDKNGNKLEGGSTYTHNIVDKVHGLLTLIRNDISQESIGTYNKQSVKLSSVKDEFVQGTASYTVGESMTTSDISNTEVKYEIGEKDLVLNAKIIGKQYTNSVTANEGKELRSNVGPTIYGADGSRTTEIDRFTRINDITNQTANIDGMNGGDPTLNINDLADLSVEEGGLITNFKDDKACVLKSGKNIRGEVDRKRLEIGVHIKHVEAKSSATGNAIHTIIAQDSDDFINPIKTESKIVESNGDKAVLSDSKTTIDSSTTVHIHTHVERKVGFFQVVDTTITTTDTTDSTLPMPLDDIKHKTTTTIAASAGVSRCTGAVAGGICILALVWACEEKAPTVQSVGNVLLSGAESFFVANAGTLMDATGDIVSGVGRIGGVATVTALSRIALDVRYGQIEQTIPAQYIRPINKEITVGTRVEADAYRSGKYCSGNVVAVKKINNEVFYDVKYDADKETLAVNATSRIATSTLQAIAASNAIGFVTMVGGGVIMAIPMVVDTIKILYQMARGKVSAKDGVVMTASNVGGITVGAAASYGTTTGLTATFGTAAGLSTTAGILVTVAPLIVLKQMESIARRLKRACHPDKGGDNEEFHATIKDLEDLFELEEKFGHFKYYEQEGDKKLLTWAGYTLTIIKQLQQHAAAVAEPLIDWISVESYEKSLKKAMEDLNQKMKTE